MEPGESLLPEDEIHARRQAQARIFKIRMFEPQKYRILKFEIVSG
jgi:hypothetical protein